MDRPSEALELFQSGPYCIHFESFKLCDHFDGYDDVVRCIVWILVELEVKVFDIEGIQSTCCVAYNRAKNEVRNCILPSNDRTKGVLCPVNRDAVRSKDRPKKRSTKYKNFQEPIVKPNIIQRQQAQREKWLKSNDF